MELRPSWEANSCSICYEIHRF